MSVLQNLIAKSKDIDTTIRVGAAVGVLWVLLATLLGALAQLQLFLNLPVPYGYGIIRPLYTNALIFGGLLSLFLALFYYLIKERLEGEFQYAPVALAAFKLQQLAVVLGLAGIALGYNKGREYGEFNFISDNLMLLALIHVLVVVALNLKKCKTIDIPLYYLAASVGGMLASYIIGNGGLPYSPYAVASFFTGLQDQTVQEIYRLGLLNFYIIFPVMALLTAFIPEYFGVPLYSTSMARFHILSSILILPLAAAAWLSGSAAPPVLQGLGTFFGIAFYISLIAGILNLHYTLSKSGKEFKNDAIAELLKFSGVLVMVLALFRLIGTPGFVQDYIGFTYYNTRDIAFDAQTYVLMLAFASLFYVFQKMNDHTLGQATLRLLFYLGLLGVAFMLVANITQGFYQGSLALQMDPKGKLLHPLWSQILVAGSFAHEADLTKPAEFAGAYLESLRVIFLIGFALLFVSTLLVIFHFLLALIKGGSQGYAKPEISK